MERLAIMAVFLFTDVLLEEITELLLGKHSINNAHDNRSVFIIKL